MEAAYRASDPYLRLQQYSWKGKGKKKIQNADKVIAVLNVGGSPSYFIAILNHYIHIPAQ